MATATSAGLARFGALLADATRTELLCALMDGRAHTGSELARHLGVAASTVSEHLSKLRDADFVTVEAHGRHRYYRLANPEIAELLETLGASTAGPDPPKTPPDLTLARTCYDHLAGELAVAIYTQLLHDHHLNETDGHLTIESSGLKLFETVGAAVDAITSAKRSRARRCLDWTQRRHHLAGAAGKQLLIAFNANGWLKPGNRPRSVLITRAGRTEISHHFRLQNS